MWKIKEKSFTDLTAALEYAKSLNEFVVIKGNEYEICGIFGVDSVKNGECPDGIQYDWNKNSRIGRVKKEKDFNQEIDGGDKL
jgi:hypothetical protein